MSISNYPGSIPESIELVESGKDYFSRLETIIENTKYEIHLQFYIIEYDDIGKKIIDLLIKAAHREVKIYILIDGFGSFSFPKDVMKKLTEIGIKIRHFSPFFSTNSFYIGRRLHHKVVVSDASIVLIGGINISNKYYGSTSTIPWLDYSIQINDSTIGKAIQLLCRNLYYKNRNIYHRKIESVINTQKDTVVNIIQNDWLKRKNEIYKAYLKSFKNAKKEVVIVGSYFFPGRRLKRALRTAANNNVRIILILSGISDIPLSRRATYHIYSMLLHNKIELYEWNKTVLHGKAAVVDGHWTTIGSFNLNNLSSFGSIEMNAEIKSTSFSSAYLLHLNDIISQCQQVSIESLRRRKTIFSDFLNFMSYWTARLILNLITYFPYKRFKGIY
jgi:cardiolipin synthase